MKEKHSIGKSQTDWKRVVDMPDTEINYSDIPPQGDDFFKNAHVRWPEKKHQITLRLDPRVIAWFKNQGKGYQSAINAVLQNFVDAHDR